MLSPFNQELASLDVLCLLVLDWYLAVVLEELVLGLSLLKLVVFGIACQVLCTQSLLNRGCGRRRVKQFVEGLSNRSVLSSQIILVFFDKRVAALGLAEPLADADERLPLIVQQKRAHPLDRRVFAPQARLAALVAQEDDVKALRLVGRCHRQLAAEAWLHTHAFQLED